MGLYDRGYIRDDYGSERETPLNLLSQKPMVILIVIFTVICYIVDFVTRHDLIFRWWSLTPQTWKQPLFYFQYLTYGFVHDPNSIKHILFNMLGLVFLGSQVEDRLGRFEFLRFYLTAIVCGGLVSNVYTLAMGEDQVFPILGASGGVEAVVMLFVMQNPRATVLLSFFFPVPAWVMGIMLIGSNFFFVPNGTATEIHLAGIALAIAYHHFQWNFGDLLGGLSFSRFREMRRSAQRKRVKSTLRVHHPEETTAAVSDEAAEADRILEKIYQQGESSLTAAERETLERHSRKLRERRGGP